MRELRGLFAALVWAVVAFVALHMIGTMLGFQVHPLPVLLACLAVAIVVWFANDSLGQEDVNPWPPPPLPRELPDRPDDQRTRRLVDATSGALRRNPVATAELGSTMAGLAARRLLQCRGADPSDPFRDAPAHFSAGFLAYLDRATTPEGRPPRLGRSQLHAYLKELDEP